MDVHGRSSHAIAVATGALLSALLKQLEDMDVLRREDIRNVIQSAHGELGRLTSLSGSKAAADIVAAMLGDFPRTQLLESLP